MFKLPKRIMVKNVKQLAIAIVVFLVMAAIFMALWNSCVKTSFADDQVKEIDYPHALGLTLFFIMFL